MERFVKMAFVRLLHSRYLSCEPKLPPVLPKKCSVLVGPANPQSRMATATSRAAPLGSAREKEPDYEIRKCSARNVGLNPNRSCVPPGTSCKFANVPRGTLCGKRVQGIKNKSANLSLRSHNVRTYPANTLGSPRHPWDV
jgi:hypothetical protein